MYDKYSGRSRRFAFVTMKTVEDANAAIEKLNGTVSFGYSLSYWKCKKPQSYYAVSGFYRWLHRDKTIPCFFFPLQEIGGREIKVNITEKPLPSLDLSLLQAEESQFVDSPYKVYVGNLAKTVTTDTLKKFFSEKGKVLSAKVSRVPGTSKSSGFAFVTFSSKEDVEVATSSLNNSVSLPSLC